MPPSPPSSRFVIAPRPSLATAVWRTSGLCPDVRPAPAGEDAAARSRLPITPRPSLATAVWRTSGLCPDVRPAPAGEDAAARSRLPIPPQGHALTPYPQPLQTPAWITTPP